MLAAFQAFRFHGKTTRFEPLANCSKPLPADTLKGVRDRAILATLLYHGMRREELCGLRVKDLHSRQGVMHFRVKGKRSKIRFIPVNAAAQRMIEDYLALTGHRSDVEGALFRPVANNRTGRLDRHLDPNSVYQNIVRKYGRETGLSAEVMALHSNLFGQLFKANGHPQKDDVNRSVEVKRTQTEPAALGLAAVHRNREQRERTGRTSTPSFLVGSTSCPGREGG